LASSRCLTNSANWSVRCSCFEIQSALPHLDEGVRVDLVTLDDVLVVDFLACVGVDLGVLDAVAGLAGVAPRTRRGPSRRAEPNKDTSDVLLPGRGRLPGSRLSAQVLLAREVTFVRNIVRLHARAMAVCRSTDSTGPTMFDLTFLGTSASVPSADRNHPGLLVEAGGHRIMIDCGEGIRRPGGVLSLSPLDRYSMPADRRR
jgi:hypothetical protein